MENVESRCAFLFIITFRKGKTCISKCKFSVNGYKKKGTPHKGEFPKVEILRQHRTEIAVQIRSQIFRQIVQKFCRHTDVCQKIYVQDAGKYASICAA
ncbi:MAG: hypothetical protein J6L99_04900, partial [Ruminococcus sp.]|nr:hypothetical protein [Ruminococcus sp.]